MSAPRLFGTWLPLFCLRTGLAIRAPPGSQEDRSHLLAMAMAELGPRGQNGLRATGRAAADPGSNPSVPRSWPLAWILGKRLNLSKPRIFSLQTARLRRRKGGAYVAPGGGLSRQLTA